MGIRCHLIWYLEFIVPVRFSGTAKTGRPLVELMFLEDGK
jgi:hypothetical protein